MWCNLIFLFWTCVCFSFKSQLRSTFRVYYSTVAFLHIKGCHHVFCFKRLCWVFRWIKKTSYVDIATEFFTFYFEKSVYIVHDVLTPLCRINPHPMTNQPSRGDDSSLRETFFKRSYLHGNQSFMQTVYIISWPRSCWICTYKILSCAINIKGVMMVVPKPCRTNPALPYLLSWLMIHQCVACEGDSGP